jgi:AraC-like DNA-binding protein
MSSLLPRPENSRYSSPKRPRLAAIATQTRQPEIALWRAPDLGADLLKGRFSNFSYDVHTHDTACFSLVTRGAIRIKMRGQELTASNGDLYAIDADEPHAGWALDEAGWSLRTLYVDTAHLRSLLSEHSGSVSKVKGPIIRDAGLSAAFFNLHRCSQIEGSKLRRQEQYIDFAATLFARYVGGRGADSRATNEDRAVRLAKEFIEAHLSANVSLTEIASTVRLPPVKLYRAFERFTGMTPHAFQRQARVRRAMELIRSNRSLVDVAHLAGFADQPHMTRWFRRMMGVTPGAYHRAMQD